MHILQGRDGLKTQDVQTSSISIRSIPQTKLYLFDPHLDVIWLALWTLGYNGCPIGIRTSLWLVPEFRATQVEHSNPTIATRSSQQQFKMLDKINLAGYEQELNQRSFLGMAQITHNVFPKILITPGRCRRRNKQRSRNTKPALALISIADRLLPSRLASSSNRISWAATPNPIDLANRATRASPANSSSTCTSWSGNGKVSHEDAKTRSTKALDLATRGVGSWLWCQLNCSKEIHSIA